MKKTLIVLTPFLFSFSITQAQTTTLQPTDPKASFLSQDPEKVIVMVSDADRDRVDNFINQIEEHKDSWKPLSSYKGLVYSRGETYSTEFRRVAIPRNTASCTLYSSNEKMYRKMRLDMLFTQNPCNKAPTSTSDNQKTIPLALAITTAQTKDLNTAITKTPFKNFTRTLHLLSNTKPQSHSGYCIKSCSNQYRECKPNDVTNQIDNQKPHRKYCNQAWLQQCKNLCNNRNKLQVALFKVTQPQFCYFYNNFSSYASENLVVLYPDSAPDKCKTN